DGLLSDRSSPGAARRLPPAAGHPDPRQLWPQRGRTGRVVPWSGTFGRKPEDIISQRPGLFHCQKMPAGRQFGPLLDVEEPFGIFPWRSGILRCDAHGGGDIELFLRRLLWMVHHLII